MALPSLTAATMVLKLSSARTMTEASLATSVPAMPIAIPMWACFKAGASFTPSPVIATIRSSSISLCTNCLLCVGSVRENTNPRFIFRIYSYSFSCNLKNSLPVNEFLFTFSIIPTSNAIYSAVSFTSPVIIITFIPAN
jgi:hypothetical protein